MDRYLVAFAGLLSGAARLRQRANPSADWQEALQAAFAWVPPELQKRVQAVMDGPVLAVAEQMAEGFAAGTAGKSAPALRTVFSGMAGAGSTEYWPLQPLALDEAALFPAGKAAGDYGALWAGFAAAMQALPPTADLPTLVEHMQAALRQFAWCVPGPGAADDVSLYDHARVTAAIAACLADVDTGTLAAMQSDAAARRVAVAQLVEGDISGVQRFIYTITARGAARGLRGRSLYLQLLTEAAARFVLRTLGLPATSLIYVGGGHFYLLAPAGAESALKEARDELDRVLLAHHDGDLYLAVGAAALQAADFSAAAFSTKWREVGSAVGASKRRRFAHLPPKVLAGQVFGPRGHGGNEEQECEVCHAERADVQYQAVGDDGDTVRKCALCASLEDLGRDLGQSRYLFLAEAERRTDAPRGGWSQVLAALGLAVGLHEGKRWVLRPPRGKLGRGVLLGFEDAPDGALLAGVNKDLGVPVAGGLRFAVNVMPRRSGDRTASFEDLQEAAQGLKRLGVLRMDVDDLGALFASGFGSQGATLARVAGLSSALATFFEGWVGALCRRWNADAWQNGRACEPVYTVYSGGDDLFIVGAWDVMPELARQIRDDLARFSGGVVHASAGITLHGGKFPLYQAAEAAHNALDDAKDMDGKDAITFLGQTVKWAGWPEVVKRRDQLVGLLERGAHRSLLQVVGKLHTDYRAAHESLQAAGQGYARDGRAQVAWGPWMWRGTYLLKRLEDRSPKGLAGEIGTLRQDLAADDFRAIEVIGLAARWAEALTRKSKEKMEA